MTDKVRCCLTCGHCEVCPIILQWVKLCEAPIEACKFYCSEYIEEMEVILAEK